MVPISPLSDADHTGIVYSLCKRHQNTRTTRDCSPDSQLYLLPGTRYSLPGRCVPVLRVKAHTACEAAWDKTDVPRGRGARYTERKDGHYDLHACVPASTSDVHPQQEALLASDEKADPHPCVPRREKVRVCMVRELLFGCREAASL